jgi:hypothetical protein
MSLDLSVHWHLLPLPLFYSRMRESKSWNCRMISLRPLTHYLQEGSTKKTSFAFLGFPTFCRDWFAHETTHHRAQWHCHFCSRGGFLSVHVFRDHLRHQHTQHITDDQLDALTEASKRPPGQFVASDCPICDAWEPMLRRFNPTLTADDVLAVTPAQFQSHLGSHMQQLALFAIPRGYLEEGEAEEASAASIRVAGHAIDTASSPRTAYGADFTHYGTGSHHTEKSFDFYVRPSILPTVGDVAWRSSGYSDFVGK